MADESELRRFRQQWKEEVTARVKGQPAGSSSSTGHPESSSSRRKRPSFSHAPSGSRPAIAEDNDKDDFTIPEPSAQQKIRSPTSSFMGRRPSVVGPPVSALEHYERAVQKEAEGSLGDSLKLYRQAFRMDDSVDKLYKEKHFPRVPVQVSKGKAPVTAENETVPAAPPVGVSDLIDSFMGLRIEPEIEPSLTPENEGEQVENEQKFCLLAAVPNEILLQILNRLAESDIAGYMRLTQVCKALCYAVLREESIWRRATISAFSSMAWDWKCTVEGCPIIHKILDPLAADVTEDGFLVNDGGDVNEHWRGAPSDEALLPKYRDSWREMFRLRPRIRYNGIYISTCNYHRSGGHSGNSLAWNTPVHIVTYYRYLRFFPDGTVLSLLTTHEPAEVVYSFSKHHLTPAHLGGLPIGGSALSQWGKYVGHGRWRLDPEGRVDLEIQPPNMERYLFKMQLRLAGGRKKGSTKLNWEGFWSWNKVTDDLSTFEGRNDKPYWFSRVGVVEKEMGMA